MPAPPPPAPWQGRSLGLSQFQFDVAYYLGGLVGRQDLAGLAIEHHPASRPRIGCRRRECTPQRQKVTAKTEGERLCPWAVKIDIGQIVIVEQVGRVPVIALEARRLVAAPGR